MDKHFWYCVACKAQNSRLDGECQWCECGGKDCKRDNCDGPEHGMTNPIHLDRFIAQQVELLAQFQDAWKAKAKQYPETYLLEATPEGWNFWFKEWIEKRIAQPRETTPRIPRSSGRSRMNPDTEGDLDFHRENP